MLSNLPVAASRSSGVDLISGSGESFFASRRWIPLQHGTSLVRVQDEEDVLASAGVDQIVEHDRIGDVHQVKQARIRGTVSLFKIAWKKEQW